MMVVKNSSQENEAKQQFYLLCYVSWLVLLENETNRQHSCSAFMCSLVVASVNETNKHH